MISRRDLLLDVSDAAELGEPAWIAGTIFVPDRPRLPLSLALLVPGGGFTRRYYDLELQGYEDYSMATQLAASGVVVVAVDNLGTGASTRPQDGRRVTLDRSAAALAAFAEQLRERARQGTLDPSLPPSSSFITAIGHSLGGCLVTILQGLHGACDALAILGFSCQYIKTAVDPKTGERLRPRIPTGDGYNRSDPTSHRDRFYAPDVPLAVIQSEEAARVAMPDGLAEVLIPGRSAEAAARITAPVFLGFGEFDVSPDPWLEPSFFRASNDVALLILQDAAHCHNSAGGRTDFWRQISGWMELRASTSVHG